MKFNEEMKKSIMDEAAKRFGNELSDELLDIVNCGRDITYVEEFDVSVKTSQMIDAARDGLITSDELKDFMESVMNYRKYIQSLPDDSPLEFFDFGSFTDSSERGLR